MCPVRSKFLQSRHYNHGIPSSIFYHEVDLISAHLFLLSLASICFYHWLLLAQLLSHLRMSVTPWIASRQASLSITISWSLPKLKQKNTEDICSVQFSHSVVSDSLRPHESQHARPPCPSPTPGVHSNSRPSSLWCHPAISSSVVPFSSCPQSLPASGSFPESQFFQSGGQRIGVSASVIPIQGWFHLAPTDLMSFPISPPSKDRDKWYRRSLDKKGGWTFWVPGSQHELAKKQKQTNQKKTKHTHAKILVSSGRFLEEEDSQDLQTQAEFQMVNTGKKSQGVL